MQVKAWGPALVCALLFVPGCPTDEDETGGDPTSDSNPSSAGSETGDELGCAAGAMGMGSDGATDDVMMTWGAQCSTDADCEALVGTGGICATLAVAYELPGGYCTKACQLPDPNTRAVPDDPTCDPAGGVACIGVMGQFERCAVLCTDDAQCSRDGYICRQMPLVSTADDPKACLMPDCCEPMC